MTITDRGLALIDEAVSAGLEVQRAALTGLTDDEVAVLTGLLRRLLAAV